MLNQKIYALVLAGKRKSDPLSEYFGLDNKAFIKLKNKYLIEWVIEALQNSAIQNIIISLQKTQKSIFETNLNKKHTFLEANSLDSPIDAVFQALNLPETKNGLLITTADNVFLSSEIIAYFLNICQKSSAEIIIATVNGKDNLSQNYPNIKRTWHKLNSQTWLSGANLFFWKPNTNKERAYKVLYELEANRKSPFKFAQIIAKKFSLLFFLKLLFRQTSIKECSKAFSEAVGLKVELITLPFPQACIDIDRLSDLKFAENIL